MSQAQTPSSDTLVPHQEIGATEYKPQDMGWGDEIANWFGNAFPGMPMTEGVMNNIREMTLKAQPGMEQFFGDMLRTGGMPDMQAHMRTLGAQGVEDRRATERAVTSSGGYGGSSAAGTMTREMRRGDLNQQEAMGNTMFGLQGQAQQNQFGGAQGLMGMPGYMATPSALETAMMQMRQPYDMMQGGYQRQRFDQNWWNPAQYLSNPQIYSEHYLPPSWMQEYGVPLLNAGSTIAGSALGGGGGYGDGSGRGGGYNFG